ncbi:hypothetical protein EVAR_21723_1 [Eumeta japonica]|uniref:Uncharacterized protein n=1 Tax=Eumeta variegata TaxID=151549 RepID=A0A4C1W8W5_EUMVA|nr:hypothetical protein EVAR_21723_1 [Eumeta japonica]
MILLTNAINKLFILILSDRVAKERASYEKAGDHRRPWMLAILKESPVNHQSPVAALSGRNRIFDERGNGLMKEEEGVIDVGVRLRRMPAVAISIGNSANIRRWRWRNKHLEINPGAEIPAASKPFFYGRPEIE